MSWERMHRQEVSCMQQRNTMLHVRRGEDRRMRNLPTMPSGGRRRTVKIELNNDNKVFMSIPNINYWYEDSIYIYVGWLFWGFNIVIKE